VGGGNFLADFFAGRPLVIEKVGTFHTKKDPTAQKTKNPEISNKTQMNYKLI
jgi:hypothetical protein